jgi:hypothetical protein
MAGRDASRDESIISAQSAIYEVFIRSETQNEAHGMVEAELLSGELYWTVQGKTQDDYDQKLATTSKEYRIWSTFIRRLFFQMTVFGFAVYRLVRVGKTGDLEHKRDETSE